MDEGNVEGEEMFGNIEEKGREQSSGQGMAGS